MNQLVKVDIISEIVVSSNDEQSLKVAKSFREKYNKIKAMLYLTVGNIKFII